jgi:hypothetical protein
MTRGSDLQAESLRPVIQFIGDAAAAKAAAQCKLDRMAKALGYLEAKIELPGYRAVTEALWFALLEERDICEALGAKWKPQCETDYLEGRDFAVRNLDFRR